MNTAFPATKALEQRLAARNLEVGFVLGSDFIGRSVTSPHEIELVSKVALAMLEYEPRPEDIIPENYWPEYCRE